jgi:HD-GYP domain-containing protein (c-di-GMP phosphodiesterase class II)
MAWSGSPFLAPVAPLVRSAHERVDGGGYPGGLRGEEIPRGAMVIATCDAYHAMTSNRSYRRAMGEEAASCGQTPAPSSTRSA